MADIELVQQAHLRTLGSGIHAWIGAVEARDGLAVLGALQNTQLGRWTITESLTKMRASYGRNTSDLIDEGDPERNWFEKRFAPLEYDKLIICPLTETFADRYEV